MPIVRMTRKEYLQHNPGIKSGEANARQQAADEILLDPDDVEQIARDLGLPLPNWFDDWKRGPWMEAQGDGIIIDDHPNKHKFGGRPARSNGIRPRLRKR